MAKTEKNMEEAFEILEGLIERLEKEDCSLEDAFAFYEKGMKLVKSLNTQIDKVEKQILILSEGEDNE